MSAPPLVDHAVFMKRAWIGIVVMALAGCGTSSTVSGPPGGTASAGPEKPQFAAELERTCADGLGYTGLPAYTKAKGAIHKAVMMEKRDDTWHEGWSTDSDYPRTWFLGAGQKPDQVELVVCVERVKAFANGKKCKMEHRDTKEPFTLSMYDTSYLVRVLEARSGKTLLYHAGTAKSQECPVLTFNSGDDDPTKHYTEADAKDYRPLIKPFIAP
jgi:hypothetical protein